MDRRIQGYLKYVARNEVCDWCKYPYKPVYRKQLCRHCYRIKRELKYLHQIVLRERGPLAPEIEFRYKVALKMAESAQIEGRMYGSPAEQEVSPLKLEREFRFLSEKFVKANLYDHAAYLFEYFTSTERTFLYYVISGLSREYLRRNRRRHAQLDVCGKPVEEILKGRCHGTYRVEDDF